jgi:hypothetical protein
MENQGFWLDSAKLGESWQDRQVTPTGPNYLRFPRKKWGWPKKAAQIPAQLLIILPYPAHFR